MWAIITHYMYVYSHSTLFTAPNTESSNPTTEAEAKPKPEEEEEEEEDLRQSKIFNMGNYTSLCSLPLRHPKSDALLLLGFQGNLRRQRLVLPFTAAELMLDEPGHVVVQLDDLRRTRRIIPLRADDELAAGKAYLLVKSQRVNSKVLDTEFAALDAAAACKKRQRQGGSRVSPAAEEGEKGEDRLVGASGRQDGNFTGQRVQNCRKQWRPVLETISEVA